MLTFTTWNDAAENKANLIFAAIENVHVDIPKIRYVFEQMSNTYFNDMSETTNDLVHSFWLEIGAKALRWGVINNIPISLEELIGTLVRKQRDYGHHNVAKYGRKGLIIRVHDKLARLENLSKNGQLMGAQNEPVSDTILDIAGYAAIGCMWEHKIFLLPLR